MASNKFHILKCTRPLSICSTQMLNGESYSINIFNSMFLTFHITFTSFLDCSDVLYKCRNWVVDMKTE